MIMSVQTHLFIAEGCIPSLSTDGKGPLHIVIEDRRSQEAAITSRDIMTISLIRIGRFLDWWTNLPADRAPLLAVEPNSGVIDI